MIRSKSSKHEIKCNHIRLKTAQLKSAPDQMTHLRILYGNNMLTFIHPFNWCQFYIHVKTFSHAFVFCSSFSSTTFVDPGVPGLEPSFTSSFLSTVDFSFFLFLFCTFVSSC